jgi:hypothetical protein
MQKLGVGAKGTLKFALTLAIGTGFQLSNSPLEQRVLDYIFRVTVHLQIKNC